MGLCWFKKIDTWVYLDFEVKGFYERVFRVLVIMEVNGNILYLFNKFLSYFFKLRVKGERKKNK